MADSKISPASPQPDGPSYLSNLPTELLRLILEYTLPQGLTFTFWYTRHGRGVRMLMTKDIRMWNGQYLRAFYSSRCKSCAIGKPCDNVANDTVFHLTTPLFYVNKKLSSEARAVLIAGNEWSFSIPGLHQVHENPLFGPLEQPNHTEILRGLQRVELEFGRLIITHKCARRERDHIQHFVDAFNDRAEDPDQHSMLHTLKVRIPEGEPRAGEKFELEVLSGLKRQLKKVTVEGPPEWFAKCLVLHLTGRGGPPVSTLSWPTKLVRQKPPKLVRRKTTRVPSMQKSKFKSVSTRQFWQPTLDWREYALRNGIELPDDIDKYFPPSQ